MKGYIKKSDGEVWYDLNTVIGFTSDNVEMIEIQKNAKVYHKEDGLIYCKSCDKNLPCVDNLLKLCSCLIPH